MIVERLCENVEQGHRAAMEWDDLKTFLAISREGTLSGAARSLGVSQTTAGRRLEMLHERAGVRLLQKTPSGYVLTPAGEHILSNVETMEAEALAAERVVTGEDVRLAGTVRVTTVETLAVKVLAPTLTEFRRRYPNIVMEIDIDSRPLSLARREADIALRIGTFDQHDIVVRKVGEEQIGVFAARSYLESHGMPDFGRLCSGHARIAAGAETTNLPVARWFERVAARATVAVRGNVAVRFEVARAGAGLACLPVLVARDAPELVRLTSPAPPIREIWLGVHRDMQRAPRIRAVLDFLSIEVKHAVSAADAQ
jgi:DNA-binding transcriptional LysR family regulator